MSATASSSSSWAGAAPVSEGDFAFANGDFFALASGQNRHRRATHEELSAHFLSGSEKDRPAHWFEAQLIHYGLKPSKTKSVARMRLFDAVQGGRLSVPAHITTMEDKLKKEWTKQDRLAKKATSAQSTNAKSSAGTSIQGSSSSSTAAAGAKRKANVIVNVTVNAAGPAAKKAKSENETETETRPTKFRVKQTARRGTSASARARGSGSSRGPSRNMSTADSSPPAPVATPRRNTARRSNAFVARGRIHQASPDLDDSPPPPYSPEARYGDDYGSDDNGDTSLAPLGLLNGQYDIECPHVDSEWPIYRSEYDLVFTISGSSMWGRFNLGVFEGVLFFETRPYSSSHDALGFRWRGREDQGPIFFGNSNRGWIKFLGGGRIQGWFEWQGISFRGSRFPGQGTRSEVSAQTLKNEWDGYSEEQYEEERVSRW